MHNSWKRKLLIYSGFIIAAFLLSCFALGLGFNLKARKIEQFAGLDITYQPNDARLYINDEKKTERSPFLQTNLKTGKYKVRIEKEDYLTFEDEVNLLPGQVVRLSVLLFLKNPQKMPISSEEKKFFEKSFLDRESFGVISFSENELFIDDKFIVRFSKNIKEAGWLTEDYLILQVGSEIRAISRDGRQQVTLYILGNEEQAKIFIKNPGKEILVSQQNEAFKLKIR